MTRFVLAFLAVLAGTPLIAQSSPAEEIVGALIGRGYKIILEERTWLGRQRVIAETATKRRELVFNPETGEIMRDLITSLDDNDAEVERPVGVAVSDAPVMSTVTATPKVGDTADEQAVIEDPVAPVVSSGN